MLIPLQMIYNKSDIRNFFRIKRKNISPQQYIQANGKILILFKYFFKKYAEIHCIHTYITALQYKEVDTWPIIYWLQQEKKNIAVPKIACQHTLNHYYYYKDTLLVKNKWNILEPLSSNKVSIKKIDLVILPLLAYDSQGYRVGYGKGYYDRFLKKCSLNTLKVGLSFFSPVSYISDRHVHDVAMNFCITPEKIYTF